MEVHIELLLGTNVVDVNGEKVGRIEEFRAEEEGSSCRIDAYLVGKSALVERLSAWSLIRPIKRALRSRDVYSVFEVPWQQMDLSDPGKPRLRVAKKDLRQSR
jgi:sporulation protein YlmC with PRC-barrel domain